MSEFSWHVIVKASNKPISHVAPFDRAEDAASRVHDAWSYGFDDSYIIPVDKEPEEPYGCHPDSSEVETTVGALAPWGGAFVKGETDEANTSDSDSIEPVSNVSSSISDSSD